MKDRALRVVGFDCAEEEHVAVLLDEEGEQERQETVQNRAGPDPGVSGAADADGGRGRGARRGRVSRSGLTGVWWSRRRSGWAAR